ncbi:MAG: LacI family transcriptional regulator [Armatimonadetes bacterium]|nr:LacI family transcriptional regulator [Armatimonadota bacterium]
MLIPRIDKSSPLPRHYQARQLLEKMIDEGRWRIGDKLPAEIEIAEAMGVSKMTVNKALASLVAEGRLMREVGRGTFVSEPKSVTPHVVAGIIFAVEMPIESNYYNAPLVQAIQDEALESCVDVSFNIFFGADYLKLARERGLNALVIVAPHEGSLSALEALREEQVPFVLLGGSVPIHVPCVDSDNHSAAKQAAEYFISLGHRRLALVHAPPVQSNTVDRIEAFGAAVGRYGLSAQKVCISSTSTEMGLDQSEHHLLCDMLLGSSRPTAVFAGGYHLALKVMKVAGELGLDIPSDLSLIGFDDPGAAVLLHPSLTTFRQPLYAMGRLATNLLISALKESMAVNDIKEVLPCEFVIRGSCQPLNG